MIIEKCDECKKEIKLLAIRVEEYEYDDDYGYNLPKKLKVFCSVDCFNKDLKKGGETK